MSMTGCRCSPSASRTHDVDSDQLGPLAARTDALVVTIGGHDLEDYRRAMRTPFGIDVTVAS